MADSKSCQSHTVFGDREKTGLLQPIRSNHLYVIICRPRAKSTAGSSREYVMPQPWYRTDRECPQPGSLPTSLWRRFWRKWPALSFNLCLPLHCFIGHACPLTHYMPSIPWGRGFGELPVSLAAGNKTRIAPDLLKHGRLANVLDHYRVESCWRSVIASIFWLHIYSLLSFLPTKYYPSPNSVSSHSVLTTVIKETWSGILCSPLQYSACC